MEADLSAYLADVKESVSSAGGAADAPISAPLSIVIFGATGDLAREKLYPSLVQLMRKGLLPYGSTIMAYGRSAVAIEDFCAKQLVKVDFLTAEEETRFIGCLQYFQGGYDKEEDFQRLGTALSAHETPGTDRLYFLSVPPTVFGSVCSCINRHSRAPAPGLTRVLVEKPFGRDSRTFAELNGITSAAFEEAELFRLDHYLAKQSIQNFNRQRVQRGCFFNSVWDNRCIQSLHVSWKEDIDTEGRGGYFDEFGIIRDIVQNHLLQLLMVACMDPPADPTAEAVAQAKVAFLRCVSTVQMSDVVLGQFEGYLQDKTVPEGSRCPTYAAISFTVDNDRWRGVPIMITAGKGLSERTCTVEAEFRPSAASAVAHHKSLLLRIQPEPGLWLQGPSGSTTLPFMEALPPTSSLDGYERILFDGARGSQLLMIGEEELREAWRIFTPVLDEIDTARPGPVVHPFQAVAPQGVAELAASVGMVFNPLANEATTRASKL